MRRAGVAAVALLILAGCSSPAPEPVAAPDPVVEPEPTTTAEPEPTVACEAVPAELLAKIEAGAETGTGMVVTAGAAYLSPDYESAYFIAAEFTADGIDPQRGVWVTNSLDPSGGTVMAVDGFAQEFTVWPDADSTDAAISSADPAVSVALDCLT